jgi:hypothetical protein
VVVVVEQYRERKSISYHLLATPGETGEVVVYNVDPGFKFTIERVQVAFPVGQYFELHVKIMRGLEQIKPTSGDYSGDGFVIADVTKVELGSGEPIKVWYKNDSTTANREALIIIEGYIES